MFILEYVTEHFVKKTDTVKNAIKFAWEGTDDVPKKGLVSFNKFRCISVVIYVGG